jgi:hypothetical protein
VRRAGYGLALLSWWLVPALAAQASAPLQSEGLPYVHDGFQLVGRCRTFGTGCERSAAETRSREIPMGNMLIRFPE